MQSNRPGHQPRKPSMGRQGNIPIPQINKMNKPCCPNCNAKGDIFIEVNPLVRNVVEFCEFPHRCKKGCVDSELSWKTINEL